jgi:hypothetical protein
LPFFDTPLSWARHFTNFLRVCSSLAPVSSHFSSVSIRRWCFCSLSIRSSVDLSLFTKLRIVWMLGTFYHNIYVEIFNDTFEQTRISRTLSYRNTLCSKAAHHDGTHCSLTVTKNKRLMGLITAAHCRQIINKFPRMNWPRRREEYLLFYPGDWGVTLLRNVGIHLTNHTSSHSLPEKSREMIPVSETLFSVGNIKLPKINLIY